MIDMIVSRPDLRATAATLLRHYARPTPPAPVESVEPAREVVAARP
jgi:hypothetical protein